MLRRIFTVAACFALLATSSRAAAPPKPVTTADSEGVQLRALIATDLKLDSLMKEPPPPGEASQPDQEVITPPPKKKVRHHAKRQKARVAPKVLGRRLTLGEVQRILATTRDFSGCDLSGLNLAGADLSGSNLKRANLRDTDLERADLSEADLELADLSGADLTRASLHMARFHGTRIVAARLGGALWTDRTICRGGSVGKCLE